MAESLDDLIGTMADYMLRNEIKTQNVDELKKMLNEGNRGAALSLGDIYKKQKNYAEALKYYAIPAEGGNVDLMIKAAEMAMSARFNQATTKDDKYYYQQEAIRFYEMAAANGRVEAEFYLGMIYISDKFISKRLFVFAKKENDKKGAEYLLNAAKKGYPEAQYCLAELYGDGIGVPRSMDQYFFWLRCAQINGNRKAVAELQRWLNSKAGNAVEFDLERIDPQILAHPQYIEVYRIRKEAKKIMEEKDDDD